MSDDGATLSVDEFAEYCRTQAGLLAGRAETLSEEVSDCLDEIDAEIATARDRLDSGATDAAGTVSPQSPEGPDTDGTIADLEALEDELETKQAVVEAKQARMVAFQDLATGYTDLAAELHSSVDDGHEAMTRVVRFEVDHDAPAYFPDRTTVAVAAADSGDNVDDSGDDGDDSSEG